MVTEREQQAQLGLRLLAKVRRYQDNPLLASTSDDVKHYRKMLSQKDVLSEEEQLEYDKLMQWITDDTNLYVPIGKENRPTFAIGFDDSMLQVIISKVAPHIKHSYQWVCLYHSLIGFNFMKEMKWSAWREYLESCLSDLGLNPAFETASSARDVPIYLRENRIWDFESYLVQTKVDKTKRARTEAKNRFVELTQLLDIIKRILFEMPPLPSKNGGKLSA